MHAQRLTSVEGDGASAARTRREDRELTEVVGGSEYSYHRLITQRGGDTDRKVAVDDEVQRVAGVAVMKYHFVALEPPAPGDRQDLPLFIVVERLEKVRQHGAEGYGWRFLTRIVTPGLVPFPPAGNEAMLCKV